MPLHQERLAMLAARCTEAARELLRDLRAHEQFPELVALLEQIGGTIYRLDVEKHFFELVRK